MNNTYLKQAIMDAEIPGALKAILLSKINRMSDFEKEELNNLLLSL